MILSSFILAVYVLPLLLLVSARRAVLIRGERYAGAVLVFGIIDVLWAVAGLAPWTASSTVFWLAHVLILPVVRTRWILWRMDRSSAATLLESRMRMLLLSFERTSDGYALPAPERSDVIILSSLGKGSTILVLGSRSARRKVRLLRSLTAKGFRSVYPRPVVTLRGRTHVAG
jgi:hypothetical protein